MIEDEIIKRTIIFDGEKEYKSEDIFRDKELYSFFRKSIIFSPASLFEQIINENGILYISTNKSFDTVKFDLKEVSQDLHQTFIKRYTSE